MKYVFPLNYGEKCILVPIDAAIAPFVSGALNKFQSEYIWATQEDYEKGYNAFAELQAAMTNNCLQDLIDSNDRLYRLMDTALNGTAYSATPATSPPAAVPADPTRPTFAPAIPLVPPATSPSALPVIGLRHRFERVANLLDNLITGQQFPLNPAWISSDELQNGVGLRETITALQGEINAGWFGIGGNSATLADVVNALRIGSPDDSERITTALDILSGTSSSAVIFNTVKGLFTDSVGLASEGAILGTLIASTLGNAATAGIMSGQLDRIIAALDGGGFAAPADNVLKALRGDTPATVGRNLATLATETRDLLEP